MQLDYFHGFRLTMFYVCLFLECDREFERSVGFQEVEVDHLFEFLGFGSDVLFFELDLALSAFVVLRTNVVVIALKAQNHVVEGGNVKGKGLIPNGVTFALFVQRNEFTSEWLASKFDSQIPIKTQQHPAAIQ